MKKGYIFHDSTLNVWRFHPGEIPEKPDHPCEQMPGHNCPMCEGYNEAIAAIKQNALTIGNPEICPQNMSAVEPDKFYEWIGGYETKEILSYGWVPSYNDPDNQGFAPNAEPETVAILTLPENK